MPKYQASLEGLSDDPLTRAAQVALAAIDQHLSAGDRDPGMAEAYELLCRVLARRDTNVLT